MKDPQIPETRLTALLKSNDPELQYTAMDVLSRRPDQTKTTADVLRQWLAGTELSSGQERAVANFFNPPLPGFAIQKVIDDAISNPKTAEKIRVLLLSNIEKSGINRLPALWLRGIGQSIKHEEISVRRQAIAAIKAKYIVELFRSLEELSKDAKQPLDVRIAAIECFAPKGRQLETAHFDLLMSQISETADPFNRLAAARTLAACRLSDSELIALAGQLKKANTLVLRILLPAFSKAGDSKVGSALVDALSQSTGAEALTSAQLAQVLTTYSEEVRNRAGPLRQKLLEREKGQAAYLAKIAAELESLRGDADAGQEILLSKKSACYTCHRAVGRGGQVGPDLSKIGRIRTRAELLESLVYPSLVIAPEFRSFKVNLKDGKSAQGLIINQSADAIMIRTAELAEIRIARGDIEELAPSTVSLMPEGLEKTMTRQELRNLLEFLMQQR
jgi:putative heme-binding domain-containing protein